MESTKILKTKLTYTKPVLCGISCQGIGDAATGFRIKLIMEIEMSTDFKIKNPRAKSVPGLYEDGPIGMDHLLAKAKFQSEVDATLHYLNSTSLKEAIGATLKRMRFLFGEDIPDELVRTAVSLTYAGHVALKTKKWRKS